MKKMKTVLSSRLCRMFVVLTVLCVAGLVQAKTVYINDQLRVGIRSEPNNDSAPLVVVTTGDKLQLLDTNSGYAMVRTEGGIEGWIKEIYTTVNVPAIVQLKTLSQAAGGADQKIKKLLEQISIMQSANQALSGELEQAKDDKNNIQIQLLGLKNNQRSRAWMYWLAGLFIFSVGSFMGGMFLYRHLAMKRLGGLRIYF